MEIGDITRICRDTNLWKKGTMLEITEVDPQWKPVIIRCRDIGSESSEESWIPEGYCVHKPVYNERYKKQGE